MEELLNNLVQGRVDTINLELTLNREYRSKKREVEDILLEIKKYLPEDKKYTLLDELIGLNVDINTFLNDKIYRAGFRDGLDLKNRL